MCNHDKRKNMKNGGESSIMDVSLAGNCLRPCIGIVFVLLGRHIFDGEPGVSG